MNELSAATNEELIAELCRRTSFVGVIVSGTFDAEKHYVSNPLIDSFKVDHNNHLTNKQIGRILGNVQRQFV